MYAEHFERKAGCDPLERQGSASRLALKKSSRECTRNVVFYAKQGAVTPLVAAKNHERRTLADVVVVRVYMRELLNLIFYYSIDRSSRFSAGLFYPVQANVGNQGRASISRCPPRHHH